MHVCVCHVRIYECTYAYIYVCVFHKSYQLEQKEASERRKAERAKVYIPPEEDKPTKETKGKYLHVRTCY